MFPVGYIVDNLKKMIVLWRSYDLEILSLIRQILKEDSENVGFLVQQTCPYINRFELSTKPVSTTSLCTKTISSVGVLLD